MPLDDNVKLANTGQETLYHLFVLDVKAKAGNFVYVSQLLPGEEKTVLLKSPIEAAGSENFAALASCKKAREMIADEARQQAARLQAAGIAEDQRSHALGMAGGIA